MLLYMLFVSLARLTVACAAAYSSSVFELMYGRLQMTAQLLLCLFLHWSGNDMFMKLLENHSDYMKTASCQAKAVQ